MTSISQRALSDNKVKKVIAYFTLACFFFQSTAFSSPTLILQGSNFKKQEVRFTHPEIQIPTQLGEIKKVHFSDKSSNLLIHIQDAHGNYEAQANIQAILQSAARALR